MFIIFWKFSVCLHGHSRVALLKPTERNKLLCTGAMLLTAVISANSCYAQTVGSAYTLAKLAPGLAKRVGFGNPPYAQSVLVSSPAVATAGDTSMQFVAPDSQLVTVTVKSSVVSSTYYAPAMADGEDPMIYFKEQIAKARAGTKLVIPQAVYNFLPVDCENQQDLSYVDNYIDLNAMQDVIIDGQGSTLNFVSSCSGISVSGSARITLQNFNIDWPEASYAAVGTVTAVGGNSVDGYTYDLQVPVDHIVPNFAIVTAWDSLNNYWSLTAPHDEVFYSIPYNFSSQGMATSLPSYGILFAVGETLLVRAQGGKGAAVSVFNSQDVTLNNLIVHGGPNMAFFFAWGRGLHLNNCHVDRDLGHPISVWGDSVHSGSYGGDIIVENSSFAYAGDDGINIHTYMAPQPALTSCSNGSENCPVQLTSDFMNESGVLDGDTIGLFDPFSKFVGTQLSTCLSGSSCSVNVAPLAVSGGYLADLSATPSRYILASNIFSHNRARGALLQSPYGLVQGNTFDSQSMFAMYLVTSSYWREGPGAQNVLLVNNSVRSPGIGGGMAAVTIASEDENGLIYDPKASAHGVPPIPGVNQNIVFADNTFDSLPGAAFFASSANNVVLFGNQFVSTNAHSSYSSPNTEAAVAIYDASHVVLKQNLYSGSLPIDLTDLSDGVTRVSGEP